MLTAAMRPQARLVPSTTPSFPSRGSLAQSRPAIDSSIISDEDMAWLLVEVVNSCLTGYDRTIVFIELGCGEGYLAIKHILTVLMSAQLALPRAIFAKLTCWLNGYAGSPEEPQLRMMLVGIRRQCGPVSVLVPAAITGDGQASLCTNTPLPASASIATTWS